MESGEHSGYLKYTLNPEYFVKRETFYQNLHEKCSNNEHKIMCSLNRVFQSIDFNDKIKNEEIINQYYENTVKKLQDEEEIYIFENGLFVYENKMILYCVKDEKLEDDYLSDFKNIKCIDHEEYDKSTSNFNNNEIKENNSFKSNSKYKKDTMTGVKNGALALESLVNYYFRKFPILPLPNLIFNLDYDIKTKNKKSTSINLFFEWDGCYLFEGKDDITFSTDFILPFSKEIKYKINKNKNIEKVDNNILIRNKSIALIEVKTHFPKEKEDDNNNNLENVIKAMFIKLNYFIYLYTKILKKTIQEIKIILLYDQNRLMNYKRNIYDYLNKYK